MDQHEYEGLIEELEAEAENHPAAFRSKVLFISSAAYLVLFAVLVASALLIYFGVTWASEKQRTTDLLRLGVFALVMAPVFYAVLRMFFMRLTPPEGRAITREEAPKLFKALDKMRKKLRGPPIHHVLIDREYNAAIMQLPRWGLFGGHTNYLMLGLPYMLGTPPKEMLATVAHEYGHLCGDHGKLGSWVYRQRRTFGALYEQVEAGASKSWVHAGMEAALRRFMPYYNAYTFVLSRQNEYEADQTATELVGSDVNASGLIRDALLGRWVHEDFWPKVYKQADTSARPLFRPFAAMRTAFQASFDQWATRDRLTEAWRVQSDLHDTHPSLCDRVDATGERAKLPEPITHAAAEVLLGETAKQLIEEMDKAWWHDEKKQWEARHQYATRALARMKELNAQALSDLSLPDLQELAMHTSDFDSPQAAKPVLEHLMRQPGGPFAKPSYLYGRILLDEGNDGGLDHLLIAARSDKNLLDEAARAGYFYLRKKRGEAAAQTWWNKITPAEDE